MRSCSIYLADYQRENLRGGERISVEARQAVNRWQPPSAGTVKLNIDVATNANVGCLGFGAVCRDHTGHVLSCWTRTIYRRWPVLVAEALCLKFAIQWVLTEGLTGVVIETDAKGVVDHLLGKGLDCSEVAGILDCCRLLLQSCSQVCVQFVKRDVNSLADGLAKASFNWLQPMYWLSVPQFVNNLADIDVSSLYLINEVYWFAVRKNKKTFSDI
ncbi:hypothetical protein M5689_012685 [Euphorbia peplus]|nr:hypothetical protein M5689_012685 [Euphorbia peplus]